MNTDLITKPFEAMGSRLKLRRQVPGQFARGGRAPDFRIDIARDRRGEFFDLAVLDDSVELQVVDLRPEDRHLLLLARSPSDRPVAEKGLRKFLCGHDERHWFVAEVPDGRGASVAEAMDALKPAAARASQIRHRVKPRDRHRRKNAGFRRQGEWFFVPAPELSPDDWLVLRHEPLRRGRGKPHWVERLYRRGGTTVHVCGQHPNGLTEREHAKLLREVPGARYWPWRTMRRDPEVYARGKIRHPDHKTIALPFWHRVLLSQESRSANVAFLD